MTEKESEQKISIGRCIFVATGSFNPAIMQPLWIERHKILPEAETAGLYAAPIRKEIPELKAVIEYGQNFIVSPQQTILLFRSFFLKVEREKFEIWCESRENFPLLISFIKKIFKVLPETPVKSYGINFDEHIKSNLTIADISEKFFHKSDNIEKLFGKEYTCGHKIFAKMGDAELRFGLEPSKVLEDGIYVRLNFHYENETLDKEVAFMVENLDGNFKNNFEFAESMIRSYFGKIEARTEKLIK